MTDERWHEIEKLFAATADKSPEAARALLDAECAGDVELRRQVEKLLAADHQADDFLENVVKANASAVVDQPGDRRIGTRIGPYRISSLLGRGGMCSVYLGIRADEQFRKRVAIKIVRRGMDTDDILRRFRSERQILASLDHANVARLLDGGTTDDGVPFFVMEYIDGLPIDAWCDHHRLSISRRLELFRDVCSAVHYAHRNLVVHRDLKPSNVLVTAEGVAKLLDFGIAKLLNPELAEGTLAPTGRQLKLMTPGYASPEQVMGESITTASDVYSLGVLLFELLTGCRPYRLDGGLEDLERVICGQVPEKPSVAVHWQDSNQHRTSSAEGRAHHRGATPEQLRRTLHGDLDTIVSMALRKEPARRYGSVEQMSEDVGRYLAGHPLIARNDTVGYRTAKFVRRHRLGVSLATIVAVLILALVIGLARQSAEAMRERDRAARVAAMLNELFEIADPGEERGSTITARELLDRGVEQIEELADEPETAMLLATLARLYEELGLYSSSVPLRLRAVEIWKKSAGEASHETADALNSLGRTLAIKGDFRAAEPRFREALVIRRQLYDSDHPRILGSINNLALILHDLGEYQQATELYDEGLDLYDRIVDDEERAEAYLLGNRALLHYDMGEYAAAEALYRQVLDTRQRALGNTHPMAADALDGLGMTLHASGRLGEAEESLREALAVRLQELGERSLDVARSRTHLARVLIDRGALQEAKPLLDQAVESRREIFGEQHPEVAATLEGLAHWYLARAELDQAEDFFRQTLDIYRASLPPAHPVPIDAMLSLAEVLEERGQHREAEPLLREAVEVRRQRLPAGSWQIAEVEGTLGACLAALGSVDGRQQLTAAAAAVAEHLGAEHRRTQRLRARLTRLDLPS